MFIARCYRKQIKVKNKCVINQHAICWILLIELFAKNRLPKRILFVKQVTSYFSTFPSLLWITYPISGWMSSVKQRSSWGQPVFCSELRKVVPRSGNIIMIAQWFLGTSVTYDRIYIYYDAEKNMHKNNCHPFQSY